MTLLSTMSKDWETPPLYFDHLNRQFLLNYDAAASVANTLCRRFSTLEGTYISQDKISDEDGLTYSWQFRRVFCNPPYDHNLHKWVEKTAEGLADIAVLLLPASVDTKRFHDHIYHNPNCFYWFERGRIKFLMNGKVGESPRGGNLVAVFKHIYD